MKLKLRYWGVAARFAGRDGEELTLPDGARVQDAILALATRPGCPSELRDELARCAFALKDTLVRRDAALYDGALLDVLPPVSGG